MYQSMLKGQNLFLRIFTVVLCLNLSFQVLAVTNVGLGFSSHTSGRSIPAINMGTDFSAGKGYVGFTAVGVQSKAYYDTNYSVTILKLFPGGTLWSKPIKAGIGIGFNYGEKGLDPDPLNQTEENEPLQKDKDYGYGPAFKVTYLPFGSFYLSVEYTMGLGPGVYGLGFGDEGIWSMGWEF